MWIRTETGMPVNLALAHYIRIKEPSGDTKGRYQLRAVFPGDDQVIIHTHATIEEARGLQAGLAEDLMHWSLRRP
jgi:hypothetical protein